jgi:hypothetical protein
VENVADEAPWGQVSIALEVANSKRPSSAPAVSDGTNKPVVHANPFVYTDSIQYLCTHTV